MRVHLDNSKKLFKQAQKSLVGGVNSPVRSFTAVGGNMIFAQKANGPYLWDAGNNKYIDYIMNWGVGILGHAPRTVLTAAINSMKKGSSFGLCVENEFKLAQKIKKHFKSIKKIRTASLEELSALPGINCKVAEALKSGLTT